MKRHVLFGVLWVLLAAVSVPTGIVAGSGADEGDDERGRAYLGVQIEEETDGAEGGARITEVVDGSPAERAGLEAGDVIIAFDGASVRGPAGLTKQIRAHEAGDRVEVVVLRDGKKKALSVELADRRKIAGAWVVPYGKLEGLEELGPEFEEQLRKSLEGLKQLEHIEIPNVAPLPCPGGDCSGLLRWRHFGRTRLGVQLVETTPELREHLGGDPETGVLVSKVVKGTPAEHAGVRVGDLIVSVGDDPVAGAGELREALEERAGESFPLEVIRDRSRVRLEVTLPGEEDEDAATGPRAELTPPPAPPRPPRPPAPPTPPPAPPARRPMRTV